MTNKPSIKIFHFSTLFNDVQYEIPTSDQLKSLSFVFNFLINVFQKVLRKHLYEKYDQYLVNCLKSEFKNYIAYFNNNVINFKVEIFDNSEDLLKISIIDKISNDYKDFIVTFKSNEIKITEQ